jgi:hypothetical protein
VLGFPLFRLVVLRKKFISVYIQVVKAVGVRQGKKRII